MFRLRKGTVTYILTIITEGLFHGSGDVGVFFHKFRGECFEETDEIVDDKELAVARSAGADSQCQNIKALADDFSHFIGHRLQQDGEGACLF